MVLMPLVLYRIIAPELTSTPEAPASRAPRPARDSDRSAATRKWCWSRSPAWCRSGRPPPRWDWIRRRSRFSVSARFWSSGVLTLEDIRHEGDVLATFIWFAVLFTLSSQLNELGFMGFLGQRLADAMGGLAPAVARPRAARRLRARCTTCSSARRRISSRCSACFLDVGVKLGVPPAPLAFQLLFATNYFAAITPQGSSANLLFAGSGFLSQRDLLPPGRDFNGVHHAHSTS